VGRQDGICILDQFGIPAFVVNGFRRMCAVVSDPGAIGSCFCQLRYTVKEKSSHYDASNLKSAFATADKGRKELLYYPVPASACFNCSIGDLSGFRIYRFQYRHILRQRTTVEMHQHTITVHHAIESAFKDTSPIFLNLLERLEDRTRSAISIDTDYKRPYVAQ